MIGLGRCLLCHTQLEIRKNSDNENMSIVWCSTCSEERGYINNNYVKYIEGK